MHSGQVYEPGYHTKPGTVTAIAVMTLVNGILNILFGNVISLVVGILALVFYTQPEVKGYFAALNAGQI